MADASKDLLKRVDRAVEGTAEDNAWNSSVAAPPFDPDQAKAGAQAVAIEGLKQHGALGSGKPVKVTNLPIPS